MNTESQLDPRVDQIVTEFLVKGAQLVHQARTTPSPDSGKSRPNHWFHLEAEDVPAIRWKIEELRARTKSQPGIASSGHSAPPKGNLSFVLQVHLKLEGDGDESALGFAEVDRMKGELGRNLETGGGEDGLGGGGDEEGRESAAGTTTLIEQWTLSYERGTHSSVPGSSSASPRSPSGSGTRQGAQSAVIYKSTVIMLRSLYSLLRMLPAHRLFRACKRNQGAAGCLQCRLVIPQSHAGGRLGDDGLDVVHPSSLDGSDPSGVPAESDLRTNNNFTTFQLAPVCYSPLGSLRACVSYRSSSLVSRLVDACPPRPPLPRIIQDYVNSPTGPLRPAAAGPPGGKKQLYRTNTEPTLRRQPSDPGPHPEQTGGDNHLRNARCSHQHLPLSTAVKVAPTLHQPPAPTNPSPASTPYSSSPGPRFSVPGNSGASQPFVTQSVARAISGGDSRVVDKDTHHHHHGSIPSGLLSNQLLSKEIPKRTHRRSSLTNVTSSRPSVSGSNLRAQGRTCGSEVTKRPMPGEMTTEEGGSEAATQKSGSSSSNQMSSAASAPSGLSYMHRVRHYLMQQGGSGGGGAPSSSSGKEDMSAAVGRQHASSPRLVSGSPSSGGGLFGKMAALATGGGGGGGGHGHQSSSQQQQQQMHQQQHMSGSPNLPFACTPTTTQNLSTSSSSSLMLMMVPRHNNNSWGSMLGSPPLMPPMISSPCPRPPSWSPSSSFSVSATAVCSISPCNNQDPAYQEGGAGSRGGKLDPADPYGPPRLTYRPKERPSEEEEEGCGLAGDYEDADTLPFALDTDLDGFGESLSSVTSITAEEEGECKTTSGGNTGAGGGGIGTGGSHCESQCETGGGGGGGGGGLTGACFEGSEIIGRNNSLQVGEPSYERGSNRMEGIGGSDVAVGALIRMLQDAAPLRPGPCTGLPEPSLFRESQQWSNESRNPMVGSIGNVGTISALSKPLSEVLYDVHHLISVSRKEGLLLPSDKK